MKLAAPKKKALLSRLLEIDTPVGVARICHSAQEISVSDWENALGKYAKDGRYYQICEEALSGFEYRYFTLREKGTDRLLMIQPFFLHSQDLLAGLKPALRKPFEWLRQFWPGLLKMRMLMVGCTAGEAHLGLAADVEEDHKEAIVQCMLQVLHRYGKKHKVAVITFKDFAREDAPLLKGTAKRMGYVHIPSFPATALQLDTFTSFEDYLDQKLSKVMRKNLRRKFRSIETQFPVGENEVEGSKKPALLLEVTSSVEHCLDEVQALYAQVLARSNFRFEELTHEYFQKLGETMNERARFFIWRLAETGQAVAFSACLVHEDTLYDNYLGLEYKVALDLNLYFVTIRDVLTWSIQQGLKFYYSTPLNYEPKLRLKFDLVPLDLYVRHVSHWINPFFGKCTTWLEPTQYDKFLPQFSNFEDIRC